MDFVYQLVATLFMIFGALAIALIPVLAISWIIRKIAKSGKKTASVIRQ